MSWPSIEKALVVYLAAETGAPTATKTPENLETLPKFIRVTRGPGTDDLITDAPLIDIEAFATKYGAAGDLAEQIREAMHRLSGGKAGTVLIDRVRTASSPMWLDYRNSATNRFVASYRIEYRQT